MSDKEQKNGFDDDLLTRSYERLKEVQPPASLDRRILAVAGEEASRRRSQRKRGWAGWRYRFAAAATILLTVSVAVQLLTESRFDEMPEPGSIHSESTWPVEPALSSEALVATRADRTEMDRGEEPGTQTMTAMESGAEVPDDKEVVQRKVVRQRGESMSVEATDDATETADFAGGERDTLKSESTAPQEAHPGLAASAPGNESLPEAMRLEPDKWLAAIDELLDNDQEQWARREIALFRERWPDRELDEKYDVE